MATAALLGGTLGAAGNITGGILAGQGGGTSSGDQTNIALDPALNAAIAGFTGSAFDLIGRTNTIQQPDPFEQLVGRIQSLSIDGKTKRRALTTLFQVRDGVSADQLRSPGRLQNVLERLGLRSDRNNPGANDDIARIFKEVETFEAEQAQFEASGAGQLNRQTVIDRLQTAAAAARQGNAAAQFAETGTPQNAFQQSLFDQQQRRDREFRESALGNANFGNLAPGKAFDAIRENQERSPLRLVEAALQASLGLSSTLQPGLAAAGNAAQLNSNASQGAASIAAQQANALNAIQAQSSRDANQGFINGIASGIGAFGSGVSTFGAAGGFGGFGGPGAPAGGLSASSSTNPFAGQPFADAANNVFGLDNFFSPK